MMMMMMIIVNDCSDRERSDSQCVGCFHLFKQWNLPVTFWRDWLDNSSMDAQYLLDKSNMGCCKKYPKVMLEEKYRYWAEILLWYTTHI